VCLSDCSLFLVCEVESFKHIFYLFIYCFFTICSRYLKRVISKRDGFEYLKQVPSKHMKIKYHGHLKMAM
jgi:hypothetical protein